MVRKNIFLFIIGAILFGGATGWGLVHNASQATQLAATPTPTVAATATPQDGVISYNGEEGKNALELLKKNHTVTEENSTYGTFVKGIDGKVGDDKNYWAFYVNGAYASVGAASYTTKATDKLEWKFEAVK